MRYKWLILPAMLLAAGMKAQAVENVSVTLDIENSAALVSGLAQPGENVCIDIYRPGKAAADLEQEEAGAVLAFRKPVQAGADGVFSQTVILPEGAGAYPLQIMAAGDEAPYVDVLYYTTKVDFAQAVERMNQATAENIGQLISENKTALGWNNPLYHTVSPAGVAKRVMEGLETEKLNAGNPAAVGLFFDRIVALQAMEEEKAIPAEDVIAYFNLAERFCNAWQEKLSQTDRDAVLAGLIAGDYPDDKALGRRYEELTFLKCVEKLNGYENIEQLIAAYTAQYDIGVNMAAYQRLDSQQKKNVNNAVLGKVYASYTAFAEAYNQQIQNAAGSKGQGNNSSGGGGGGSQIDITTVLPVEIPEAEPAGDHGEAFTDLADYAWAKTAIEALYQQGVIDGMGDGRFAPEAYVTREQFVKMVVCAYGLLDIHAQADFADVPAGDWSYAYIASAVQAGIVAGIDGKHFGYGMQITREDAAVIISRVQNNREAAAEPAVFADDSEIAAYARQAVYGLAEAGIITGVGNNQFAPKAKCRRCEAAQIIYQSLQA